MELGSWARWAGFSSGKHRWEIFPRTPWQLKAHPFARCSTTESLVSQSQQKLKKELLKCFCYLDGKTVFVSSTAKPHSLKSDKLLVRVQKTWIQVTQASQRAILLLKVSIWWSNLFLEKTNFSIFCQIFNSKSICRDSYSNEVINNGGLNTQ